MYVGANAVHIACMSCRTILKSALRPRWSYRQVAIQHLLRWIGLPPLPTQTASTGPLCTGRPGPAVAEVHCVLQALEAVAAKEPILVRQCLEKRQASHIHQQLCDRLLAACAVHTADS